MSRPGFRLWVRSAIPARRRPRLQVQTLEDRTVPTFTAAASFPVGGNGSNPVAVAVGDFNGDGHLDAVSANQAATHVNVLLGNGDGTFGAPTNVGVGGTPYHVRAVDLNADGKLDLVTANRTANAVAVLLGNGDGTFQAPVTFSTGSSTSPFAVDAGDLDGDGDLDLVTANASVSSASVLLGDGTGQFGSATSVNTGGTPAALALGDFNDDGRPDIATTRGFSAVVNLNDGTGGFGAPTTFAITGASNGLAVGDFNHDGVDDLAAAHPFATPGGVSVLLATGSGGFQPYVRYDAGLQTPAALAVADLNADGHPELVTANDQFGNNSVSVLPGRPDGTFGPARVYHAGLGPVSVAAGDFTGDGAVDVVTADTNGDIFAPGTVSLLRGAGDGSLLAIEAVVVSRPGATVPGDFNRDGKADLAVVTWEVGYNGVTFFPGLGTGKFGPGVRTAPISIVAGLSGGDFNEDGKPDLAVTGSAGVTLLLGNGDGTFTTLGAPLPAGSLLTWAESADLNNDTHADLVVGNNAGVSVLLGNGDGTFAPAAAVNAGGAVSHLAAADLDGDGDPDLAVINSSSSQVSVLLGNGDGTFGAPASFAVGGGPGSVSVGDLDGDSDLDLIATYHVGTAFATFFNTGAGSFAAGTPVPVPPTGGRPYGSAVVDLDGDGAVEVVTVNNFADTVTVFSGAGGAFAVTQTYAVGSRPEWVAAADFNGDGRPDLAVTNSIASTVSVLATPRPATHFGVTLPAGPVTAGQTVPVTVEALTADGEPDVDFRGAITFASDDGSATLPGPYTFTSADAGRKTFEVTLRAAGVSEVSVSGDLGTVGANVVVKAADADHMTFAVPAGATAGSPFDVTVTALDPFGNAADGYRGTVTFQTTDANPAVGLPADYTFTAGDAGTRTFAGVKLVTAGSRTVTVTADGLPDQSAAVAVSPAAAAKLTLTAPTATTAGTVVPVTVTAFDPFDNLATGFTGTVQFTTTDPIADVPADYTFVAGDQGAHTFQATLKRAGAQALSVGAAGLTGAQQGAIQVSPAGASKLGFVRAPANMFRLTATPVTVQVQDAFGNPVGAMVPVTLSFGANPGAGRLRGMTAKTNAAGLATFPKLQLTRAGVGYTLVANAPNLTTGPSDPFTVYTASRFKLALSATTAVAGAPITVTVTAVDGKGNVDPTYRGTVHFTSTAFPLADLPADYTFTAQDAGQHQFQVSLNKAGLRRLLVVDTAKMGVRGRAAVTVTAGATAGFAVTGLPLTVRANVARSFVVTAVDAYGNRATGYTGTVTFGGTGTVTASRFDFAAKDHGRRVFVVKFPTAGTGQSLTVVDQNDSLLDGAVTGIAVI